MRVLVTGAAGFIGQRLVKTLRKEHEVFALGRGPALASVRHIVMDLSLGLDVTALPDRVDSIIHLAQSEHYREFPERADHIYSVNVESTFRLLEYARKARASRFVLASSGGVYGYSQEALKESAPLRPPDFYLGTKQLSEILLFAYERFFNAVAVRPFFVYGKGQRPTMFIPRLVRNVLSGSPITVSPPDGLLVNPIHVKDAAAGFAAAMTVDFAGPINLGGPDVLSLGEIARIIGSELKREPVIERVSDAPGNVVADLELMSRTYGAPRVKFRDGIEEVCREALAEVPIGGR